MGNISLDLDGGGMGWVESAFGENNIIINMGISGSEIGGAYHFFKGLCKVDPGILIEIMM